ncbi:DUF3667 domain-containing protein [Flavobacterium capsici]|uniref:DUF3667 domain-containing protein n=1 Tax=Flavobacterium capsici TaxID=3075618 RepID=A0AA96J4A3_9FLAO|nr:MULTISPECIES: DUF3667 domain-containing protein [unclassified Flavobacterium]WNM20192.1 DUF3667 domain-containing protein [Flavobacterium sp. PMR2A8]WNM21582.1 DUF3667 domain-containing protein [Flavobacterium sp. PMTSA4]
MDNNCLNCSQPITQNFCSNCGQKKFKRIDKKYLLDEIQYLLVHTNKGFFYSIKKILLNPGKTAREFIDGNRVNHYKPILLAFILSGLSTFISFKIIGLGEMMDRFYKESNISTDLSHDIMSFMSNYNSVMMLLIIPIVSLLTVLSFRNWGNNYYEHVVMNAYIYSCYTVLYILIAYPVLYFLKDSSSGVIVQIVSLSIFAFPAIMVWFYKGFYPDKSLGAIITRVLLFILLGFALYILLIILIVIIVMIVKGPEALMQMQQPPK